MGDRLRELYYAADMILAAWHALIRAGVAPKDWEKAWEQYDLILKLIEQLKREEK